MPSGIRVTWNYDSDPDLSYLEQWDTPEKYYDAKPDCPVCESSMDYTQDHIFVCDEEDCSGFLDFSIEPSGSNAGVALDKEDKTTIPFEDYMAFYGNPSRHVTLSCYVETKCSCCGGWTVQSSCCGFDFMDTDSFRTGTFDAMDVADELNGYQLEESFELILEAMSNA